MRDVMLLHARRGSNVDCNWACWDSVSDQYFALKGGSRAGSTTPSNCKAGVTRVRSLSRCHSSDAEDALHPSHRPAEQTLLQPAQASQQEQSGQEPCTASLQILDAYLISSGTSEHLHDPLAYGHYDELAMDGSCASSQSDDSFLSLMLGAPGLSSQQPDPGCLTAVAAPPDTPLHCLLPGASKAACAEQPPRGSEGPGLDASLQPAASMLDDMFMPVLSSDGSADWFSSAGARPLGSDLSTLQQAAAQPAPVSGRKRGRPRRYDTTLPLGTMDAHMAGSVATVNGMQLGVRKRGAKPKYKFMTAEEAVAHRRERNRSTAIATHEKKKAREAALKAELSLRQGEHDALLRLLNYVQQPKADKDMVRKLLLGEEGAEGSICDAMEYLLTAGD